jgi:hypothetical protein
VPGPRAGFSSARSARGFGLVSHGPSRQRPATIWERGIALDRQCRNCCSPFSGAVSMLRTPNVRSAVRYLWSLKLCVLLIAVAMLFVISSNNKVIKDERSITSVRNEIAVDSVAVLSAQSATTADSLGGARVRLREAMAKLSLDKREQERSLGSVLLAIVVTVYQIRAMTRAQASGTRRLVV